MKRLGAVLLCLITAVFFLNAEGSQESGSEKAAWPKGNVQIIVPAKAGGGTDINARIFAEYLQREIGSPVVVVNQPSGGGTVAYEQVRTAKPDGMTLLFNHTGIMVNMATGRYDHTMEDFTAIAIAQSYPPQVYAVSPDAPWNNMKEFVDDAAENPGKYTIGISLGGTTHFIAGMLMENTGINLKLVEASSEVDKVAAIQGGHLTIGNLGVASAQQYEEAGKMKVLGLIDADPAPQYPQFVPAIDQGVNATWIAPLCLWGPKDMDPAIVEAINAATKGMLVDSTVQEQLEKMSETFKYRTVAEVQELLNKEDEKINTLAATLDIR